MSQKNQPQTNANERAYSLWWFYLFGVLFSVAEVVTEWLAAGETVVDLVPVVDLGFPKLPAKENLTTFPYRWKVNQSALHVLDFATFGTDFRGQALYPANEVIVSGVDGHSTGVEKIL